MKKRLQKKKKTAQRGEGPQLRESMNRGIVGVGYVRNSL